MHEEVESFPGVGGDGLAEGIDVGATCCFLDLRACFVYELSMQIPGPSLSWGSA